MCDLCISSTLSVPLDGGCGLLQVAQFIMKNAGVTATPMSLAAADPLTGQYVIIVGIAIFVLLFLSPCAYLVARTFTSVLFACWHV